MLPPGGPLRPGRRQRLVLVPVDPDDRVTWHVTGALCSCGHGRVAHEHYRAETDCASCACSRYRRARRISGWRGLVPVWGGCRDRRASLRSI